MFSGALVQRNKSQESPLEKLLQFALDKDFNPNQIRPKARGNVLESQQKQTKFGFETLSKKKLKASLYYQRSAGKFDGGSPSSCFSQAIELHALVSGPGQFWQSGY